MTSTPLRVVVADDHEAVRSGIIAILSTDPDIEVVAQADNGFAALTQCLNYAPDVALIDLRMPEKDGIWATERITAQTKTKVLVLTTYDSDDLIARALAAGAQGYLLKSTSGTELILGVRHVAKNRHVLDPAIAGSVISHFTQGTTAYGSAGGQLDVGHLTPRELEVWELLTQGLSNKEIARHLGVGITTVKTHVGSLYTKSGVSSRVQLARMTRST